MRRSLTAGSIAAVCLLAGCSLNPDRHQIVFEVSGNGGAAQRIRYDLPNARPAHGWRTTANAPVPWSEVDSTEPGRVTLEATPVSGTLTCRVLVDGKELARVTGRPGQPVTCAPRVAD